MVMNIHTKHQNEKFGSKFPKSLFLTLLIVLIALMAYFIQRPAVENEQVRASLIATNENPPDSTGFKRVTDPNGLTFPDAFGPHSDYQTEWWYYTGNVQTEEGRPFGFQFTIFRRSLIAQESQRTSEFATRDIYMAHFTVTDGAAGDFYDNERFQRGGGGAAGAQAEPYQVWIDDWAVEERGAGRYEMRATAEEVAIQFSLEALKAPALHGNNGLAQKSNEPGNASYYYSQTRLETTGTVTVKGEEYQVSGLTWKDHEYGTEALGENAIGWDWFSLQFSDGSELMYYQIRRNDGSIEPASPGSLILEDSSIQPLNSNQVQIKVLDTWTSPETGVVYPSGWELSIPSQEIELTIKPLIPNQELNVSTVYWEGAVTAEGNKGGESITARGYVELTGYGEEPVPEL